ncbi:hypothetical protein AKO1_003308 [Acrasis kona]|uniref:Tetratricopeptide repeat protein 37 n=1 Tax=Acrasis kona TaxID=1008807 RepID=A0AAW2Z9Q6_9EUKA
MDRKYVPAYKGLAESLYECAKKRIEEGLLNRASHCLLKAIRVIDELRKHVVSKQLKWVLKLVADLNQHFYMISDSIIYESHSKNEMDGDFEILFDSIFKSSNQELSFKNGFELKIHFLKLAIDSYEKLIEIEPNQSDHWYDLGCTQSHLKLISPSSSSECLNSFRNAIRMKPMDHRYWTAYGCNVPNDQLLIKQHCFVRSLQCNEKNNHVAWNCCGYLYLETNQIELSKLCFLQSQSSNPSTNAHSWIGLGLLNLKIDISNALQISSSNFKHATLIKPNQFDSNFNLAFVNYQLGRHHDAIHPLRKCLQMRNSDRNSWNLLGLCLEQLGNLQESLEAFRKANVKGNIARLYLKLNQFENVITTLESSSNHDELSDTQFLHLLQAKCNLNQNDVNLKKMIDEFSNRNLNQQLIVELGKLYYGMNRLQDAKKQFENAIKISNDQIDAHLSYASLASLSSSTLPNALKVLNHAICKFPNFDSKLIHLQVKILIMNDQFDQAKFKLMNAIRMYPWMGSLWTQFAQIQSLQKDYKISISNHHELKLHWIKQVGEKTIKSTCSSLYSHIASQLLQKSFSKMAIVTFQNDPLQYKQRMKVLAQLYYEMGMAPKYHSVVPTLQYALRMAQHALRFDPSDLTIRELVAAISVAISKLDSDLVKECNVVLDKLTSVNLEWRDLEIVNLTRSDGNAQLSLIKNLMGKMNDQMDAQFMCVIANVMVDRRNKMIEAAIKKKSTWQTVLTAGDVFTGHRILKAARLCYLHVVNQVPSDLLFIVHLKIALVDLFLASTQDPNVGLDYVEMLKEGLVHVEQALLRNNESAAAYLIAGKLLLASELAENAKYALQKAIQLDPRQPLANLTLYKIYYAAQNWTLAEQHLWAEHEIQPRDGFLLYLLAVFALESNAHAEAIKLAQKSIRLDPSGKGWSVLEKLKSVWDPAKKVQQATTGGTSQQVKKNQKKK